MELSVFRYNAYNAWNTASFQGTSLPAYQIKLSRTSFFSLELGSNKSKATWCQAAHSFVY